MTNPQFDIFVARVGDRSLPQSIYGRLAGDFMGAFADGGILFPLLVLLSFHGLFSTPKLFASAGLAYLVSACLFKIPMSVQPLKAIAIAAIATGATGDEIRVSGFFLGLFCLVLTLTHVDRLAQKVPASVIHGVQLGLGVILFTQGLGALSKSSPLVMILSGATFLVICFFTSYPTLGLLAVLGLIAGFLAPSLMPAVASAGPGVNGARALSIAGAGAGDANAAWYLSLRVMVIVSLVAPQMALTLTNSVVATVDVAKRYYGETAVKVNERRLLYSIGIGNVISSLWGGLPYCHGSGGLTAHYRGGARTAFSDVIIGVFLLMIAGYAWLSGKPVLIGYPTFLLASLLMAVGFFHVGLARPTWIDASAGSIWRGKLQLIASGVAAVITHNMLIVLVVAILGKMIARWRQAKMSYAEVA